ncbi:hypothetical protein AGMMS50256_37140 [Betaproteobacteria bacterium]|nr:hypothetical protein AGMMS50256_37140 [Betaproteobacteria bacterium]
MLRRFVILLFALMPVAVSAESIVVVVNPGSGVESLNRNEVINIFLGGFRRFSSGITAIPIDLPHSDPVREEFYRRLVGKTPSEINTYWSRLIFSGKTRPPAKAESVEIARAMVLESVGAITYLERGKVSEPLKIVFELPPRADEGLAFFDCFLTGEACGLSSGKVF